MIIMLRACSHEDLYDAWRRNDRVLELDSLGHALKCANDKPQQGVVSWRTPGLS